MRGRRGRRGRRGANTIRGREVLLLALAFVAALFAGNRVAWSVPAEDCCAAGDTACCCRIDTAAVPSCCSVDAEDESERRLVYEATCGCGGDHGGGSLHLSLPRFVPPTGSLRAPAPTRTDVVRVAGALVRTRTRAPEPPPPRA